jgi:hypothetical protein
MVVALVELLFLVLVVGLLLYGLGVWSVRPTVSTGPGPGRSSIRRAQVAGSAATARWTPAHDEVAGETRVLLRRSYVGPDGLPVVLEDRVYTAFSATDPAWESLFTEAMSGARFRCSYLNAEESAN